MSKEENYSNHSDSFTSPFSMTMPVMTMGTTSVEEQLAEMARAIAKLTKMVEEKDMQIASLINKVEAQVQNTDLAPECIDSWDQMEREFLNRFYSTRRTVSMMELTNTKQWKDEPVVDYINRWRSLSLDCKDRLSEVSTVEMCIQGMHWGLLYILQGIRPVPLKN
ncbi:hypothetical protein AAG906_014076 [Vitis piasezkii]